MWSLRPYASSIFPKATSSPTWRWEMNIMVLSAAMPTEIKAEQREEGGTVACVVHLGWWMGPRQTGPQGYLRRWMGPHLLAIVDGGMLASSVKNQIPAFETNVSLGLNWIKLDTGDGERTPDIWGSHNIPNIPNPMHRWGKSAAAPSPEDRRTIKRRQWYNRRLSRNWF